jgi:hypothetical protein
LGASAAASAAVQGHEHDPYDQLHLTRGHAPRSLALVTSAARTPNYPLPSRVAARGDTQLTPEAPPGASAPPSSVSAAAAGCKAACDPGQGALNGTPWRGPDAGRPVARRSAGATLASHSNAKQGQVARCMRIAAGVAGRGAPWAAVAAAAAVTAAATSKAAIPRASPHLVPPAAGLIAGRIGAGNSGAPGRSDHTPRHAWPPGGATRPTPGDIPNALPPGSVAQSRSRGPHGSLRHPPKGLSAPQRGPFPAGSPAPSHRHANKPCSRAQLPPIGRFTRACEGTGARARQGLERQYPADARAHARARGAQRSAFVG